MPTHEILLRMQTIRLRTLRMISGLRTGEFVMKKRDSSGLEFEMLREYEQGDDVRRIDWNSSVRSNRIMVRSFREQQNRRIMILLDDSASMHTGSTSQLKSELAEMISMILIYAADFCDDAVGVAITHNENMIKIKAPASGAKHVIACAEIIMQHNESHSSDDTHAMSLFTAIGRHTLLILVTDGLVAHYAEWWRALAMRYRVVIVRVRDRHEKEVPRFPYVPLVDPESNLLLATALQGNLGCMVKEWYTTQESVARRLGIRLLDLVAGEPYETQLRSFFERGV